MPIGLCVSAVCEKCGAIGVKHAFYTRERRFCSMACARGYSGLTVETPPGVGIVPNAPPPFARYKFKLEQPETDMSGMLATGPVPELPAPPPLEPSRRRPPPLLANSHDWASQLVDEQLFAAPVSCFRHAPIADIWNNILVGMKVSVPTLLESGTLALANSITRK